MTTELTIGAINPGYGGLPIGVAAALGGAQLAWHAHNDRDAHTPARTVMRFHHPRANMYATCDTILPMVDVLTINGFSAWTLIVKWLIRAGYKPPHDRH